MKNIRLIILLAAFNTLLTADNNKTAYHIEFGFERSTYSDNRYTDTQEYIQTKFPYSDKIVILRAENIDRYGKNDKNIAGEIYFKLDNQKYGFVQFSTSPTSNFMPQYSLGAHIYKGVNPVEFGFGYEFSKYRDQNINMIVPEYRYYLPNDWYFTQVLYYVIDNKSFAISNKIGKEAEGRYEYHIGYIYNDSNEAVEGLDMFENTESNRFEIAGEKQISQDWLIGANLSKEFYKNTKTLYKFNKPSFLFYLRRYL
ncbi:MAG: YaiO family outer membrane beta-barrel protein [Campylobacterales bacterium]|nr:YaiO family outer membrane beta-barrel protein [Campylobacterales bacterium]